MSLDTYIKSLRSDYFLTNRLINTGLKDLPREIKEEVENFKCNGCRKS